MRDEWKRWWEKGVWQRVNRGCTPARYHSNAASERVASGPASETRLRSFVLKAFFVTRSIHSLDGILH